VSNPAYVEPERLYVADDTSTMKARHMKWDKRIRSREDDTSANR
jgi:hypothetical protein